VVRVGADVTGVTRGMTATQKSVRKLKQDFTALTRTSFSLNRALIGLGAGGLAAKRVFDIGSAVEETGSKFRAVFGASTREVQAFIDEFGTLAGLSQTQAREITATTGAIVQGMGFAQRASAQFSNEVVRLAGDLASFNNIPIAETSRAIQSALTGERESLKRLGIVILETDVQKRAMRMTSKELAAQLTQQEKATATLQLVTERAGVAVGDLERTQDSAANQARALGAEIENLKESIATAMLPAMSTGVTALNKFIRGLGIMGSEAAVSVAKIELAFARLESEGGLKNRLVRILGLHAGSGLGGAGLLDPLGLDLFSKAVGADLNKSVEEAEANLRRMQEAADAVTFDIVGLTNALGGTTDGGGGAGGAGASRSLTVAVRTLTTEFDFLGNVGITVFKDLRPLVRSSADEFDALANVANDVGMTMAHSIVSAAEQGTLSIRAFVADATGQLRRLAAQFAVFHTLSAIFPGSQLVRSLGTSFGFLGGSGIPDSPAPIPAPSNPLSFPADHSAIGLGGVTLNVNVTAPNNVIEMGRDQVWLRALAEGNRELGANGFSFA